MADAVSPPIAASMPIVAVPLFAVTEFLSSVGLDPARMVAGLVGVIIVQTLLPRTATGWRAIAGLAFGSMLLASGLAPLAYVLLLQHGPDSLLELTRQTEVTHVKAMCATLIGGFAQPIMLGGKSLIGAALGRFLPAPAPKE